MSVDISHIKPEMDIDFIQRYVFWDNSQLAAAPFFSDRAITQDSLGKMFDFLDSMSERGKQNPHHALHVYDPCGD